VEAGDRNIVKIFIGFNNMASDEPPKLIYRDAQFLGSLVF
jgi:hypothetical protein